MWKQAKNTLAIFSMLLAVNSAVLFISRHKSLETSTLVSTLKDLPEQIEVGFRVSIYPDSTMHSGSELISYKINKWAYSDEIELSFQNRSGLEVIRSSSDDFEKIFQGYLDFMRDQAQFEERYMLIDFNVTNRNDVELEGHILSPIRFRLVLAENLLDPETTIMYQQELAGEYLDMILYIDDEGHVYDYSAILGTVEQDNPNLLLDSKLGSYISLVDGGEFVEKVFQLADGLTRQLPEAVDTNFSGSVEQ